MPLIHAVSQWDVDIQRIGVIAANLQGGDDELRVLQGVPLIRGDLHPRGQAVLPDDPVDEIGHLGGAPGGGGHQGKLDILHAGGGPGHPE